MARQVLRGRIDLLLIEDPNVRAAHTAGIETVSRITTMLLGHNPGCGIDRCGIAERVGSGGRAVRPSSR